MSAQGAKEPAVLLGLVGSGIERSRTPALHEAEGAALGLRLIYRTIDLDPLGLTAEDVPALLTGAARLGFDGLNITHPCKKSVIPHLDALSEDARALGAVNTILFRDGRAIGHNTDWSGFAESFRRGLAGAPLRRVALFGAGGAGAAIGYALLSLGAGEVRLVDPSAAQAQATAEALRMRFGADRVVLVSAAAAALDGADGLVNATPVGMTKYPGTSVPAALLRPELWVADAVYVPLETELLRLARARGCRVLDGGGMAVFQAVDAFRLFTGREPSAGRMIDHFSRM